jgi:oligopeptide transport system ATP-binding protein
MPDGNGVLLKVENLVKHFPSSGLFQRVVGIHAVDGISFDIRRGETFGLVGESGCGKSTAGRSILQLYRPTSGHVYFEGTDLTSLEGEDLRLKRRKMQMIFQDPYASLNPRMTVGETLAEPLDSYIHKPGETRRRTVEGGQAQPRFADHSP